MKNRFKFKKEYSVSCYLEAVAEDQMSLINSIHEDEVSIKLQQIIVTQAENSSQVMRLLSEFGIVLGASSLDPALITELLRVAHVINEKCSGYAAEKRIIREEDDFFIVKGQKSSSYDRLIKNSKAVVSIRSLKDKGMLDVFNADRLILNWDLKGILLKHPLVKSFLHENSQMELTNINLYINNSVTQTRGFHKDDEKGTIKLLIYLNDVCLENGPYCYVLGSHKCVVTKKLNDAISKELGKATDTPYYMTKKMVPILGAAGTAILSNQSGIHRGAIQATGKSRVVLVARFK